MEDLFDALLSGDSGEPGGTREPGERRGSGDPVGTGDPVGSGERRGATPRRAGTTAQRAGELVRIISDAFDEMAGLEFGEIEAEDRLAFLRDLGTQASRAGAIRDLVLGSVAKDEIWAGRGQRTFPDFIQRTSKSSKREASKAAERATTLEDNLPAFRTAFARGEISEEKIDIVARYTKTPELREKLDDPREGEKYLLGIAKVKDADVFRRLVKAWAMKHAPAQAEKKLKEQVRAEKLTLVPDSEGVVISGWLTTLNGELLNTALTAMMGVPTQADTREPMERRAHALLELVTTTLDSGHVSSAATVRPHLSIHVPFELLNTIAPKDFDQTNCGESQGMGNSQGSARVGNVSPAGNGEHHSGGISAMSRANPGSGENPGEFRGGKMAECLGQVRDQRKHLGRILSVIQAGIDDDLLTGSPPATLDDGTPINYSEVQALLCSGELQRIILTREGDVLDVGHRYRNATRQQTRAVIARDRTCRYPGCSHTISSSEIHHADYWRDGGKTNLDNLVMLCWYHHQYVHREKITITHHEHGWSFDNARGHVGTRLHGSVELECADGEAA